jgi:hypothetical protein
MTATNQVASMSASGSRMNVAPTGQKRLVIVGATGMVGGERHAELCQRSIQTVMPGSRPAGSP